MELEDADILPCWVDLRTTNGKQYVIIPLDAALQSQWQTTFGLTDEAYENAIKSYDRTQSLVGTGIAQVQEISCRSKTAAGGHFPRRRVSRR